MEVEIQHSNDENKRLAFLLEESKLKATIKPPPVEKKMFNPHQKFHKQEEKRVPFK